MNIAFLMPVWQRPRLTKLVTDYYVDRIPRGLIINSPGSNISQDALSKQWDLLMVANNPLGRKLNTGLELLQSRDIDAVMILGSDDLVTHNYINLCQRKMLAGYDLVRLQACYYLSEGQVYFSPHALPGAGVCLSRGLLDRLEWRLWDEVNHHLDASMFRRITREASRESVRGYKVRKSASSALVLDIKTHTGLWKLEPPYLIHKETGVPIKQTRIKQAPSAKAFINKHFPGVTWLANYLSGS